MSPGSIFKPFSDLIDNLGALLVWAVTAIVTLIIVYVVVSIVLQVLQSMGSNADPDIIKWLLSSALDIIKNNPIVDAVVIVIVAIIVTVKGWFR